MTENSVERHTVTVGDTKEVNLLSRCLLRSMVKSLKHKFEIFGHGRY